MAAHNDYNFKGRIFETPEMYSLCDSQTGFEEIEAEPALS
jgi:hypothetical protein